MKWPAPTRLAVTAVVATLVLLLFIAHTGGGNGGGLLFCEAARPIRVNPTVAGRHSTDPSKRQDSAQQQQQQGYQYRHQPHNHREPAAQAATPSWGRPATVTGCPATDVLAITFESSPTSSDGKLYGNLMAYGLMQVKPGDYFEYEFMWADADCNCGAEFEIGSEFRLRDHGHLDRLGFSPHSEKNSNMSARATRRWYRRRWELDAYPQLNNKFIDKWIFSAQLKPGDRRTAYFKYVRLVRPQEPGSGKVVWEQGMPSITVSSFFPGTITTRCQPVAAIEASKVTVSPPPTPLTRTPGRAVMLEATLRAELLINADADKNDDEAQAAAWLAAQQQEAAAATDETIAGMEDEAEEASSAGGDDHTDESAMDGATGNDGPSAGSARHALLRCERVPSVLREMQRMFVERGVAQTNGQVSLLHGYTARLRHRHFPTLTLWDFGATLGGGTGGTVGGDEEPAAAVVVLPRPEPLPAVVLLRLVLPDRFTPLTALLKDAVWELNVTTSSSSTAAKDGDDGPTYQNTTVVVEAFGGSYGP
jgi:hypothetical protein